MRGGRTAEEKDCSNAGSARGRTQQEEDGNNGGASGGRRGEEEEDGNNAGGEGGESKEPLLSTWNLFRLALISASMLFAVLLGTVWSINKASGAVAPNPNTGWMATKHSPLRHILLKDKTLTDELQHTDCGLLEKINAKATLELKSLVIAEMVVPVHDRGVLEHYVQEQLHASNVISPEQKVAVMTMVHMAPVEGSINKEERGEKGTLRNSAVIALLKTHEHHIHFMLIGVRVEPHLGMWTRITPEDRNKWNDVLSRVLHNKVRGEAKTFLTYGTPTRLPIPSPPPPPAPAPSFHHHHNLPPLLQHHADSAPTLLGHHHSRRIYNSFE